MTNRTLAKRLVGETTGVSKVDLSSECIGNTVTGACYITGYPRFFRIHTPSQVFRSRYSDSQAFTLTSENDKIHSMYSYTDYIPDSKSADSGTFYFVFTHLRENGKNLLTKCSRFVTNPPPPPHRQKKNPVVLTWPEKWTAKQSAV